MTDDSTTHDGDRHAGPTADGAGDGRDGTADTDGRVRRRWILRLLVGAGLGIPILVEARTFLGLFRAHVLGEDTDEVGATATPTQTPEQSVGVGDELLEGTRPRETVREARIRVLDSGEWRFDLSVSVENTTDAPYELRLGDVQTTAGETVGGGGSTGHIPPRGTGEVTEFWPLPSENRPETLQVTALTYAEEGVELAERTVTLGRVPLEG
jgi:hypothetical protein